MAIHLTPAIFANDADTSSGKADAIGQAIERSVRDGKLKPGDVLPPVRALAADLGIDKNTAAAAYRQLQRAGVVVSQGRAGSVIAGYVARDRSEDASRTPGPAAVCDGNPDPAFLPAEAEMRLVLSRVDVTPNLYGQERNHAPLVDWARGHFRADGLDAEAVFVSGGALDAIERALRIADLAPGDRVAVEEPGYMTLIALIRSLGFEPVGLRMDAEGVLPTSLEAALAGGIKAAVVTTRGQNPTGSATSATRAKALAKIAARARGVLWIDDDHSNLLGFAPYRPWHVVPEGRWLTVRSLSKLLGPDYRIAVATGTPSLVERLEHAQSLGMGWVSVFLQRTAHALLGMESVQKKIARAGQVYRDRHQALAEALRRKDLAVVPGAGLNLWIPVDHGPTMAQRLFERGWMVRDGAAFCLSPMEGIRVTTSRLDDARIPEFVDAVMAAGRSTFAARTA